MCITCISVELLILFTELERDLGLPYHRLATFSRNPPLILKKKSIVRYVSEELQHFKTVLTGRVCK